MMTLWLPILYKQIEGIMRIRLKLIAILSTAGKTYM